MPPGPRFSFSIDPKAPLKDLLPATPKGRQPAGPLLGDDLAQVPEVTFHEPLSRNTPSNKAMEHNAHWIAKINHVNQKKADAYVQALVEQRADLSGLPFAMGDDCRLKEERSRLFNQTLQRIRNVMSSNIQIPISEAQHAPERAAQFFWQHFQSGCLQEDHNAASSDRSHQDNLTQARVGALMQVLGPESPAMRRGLVKHLSAVSHVEATRALARLAIFAGEEDVRGAALEALKIRREKDYTDILLQGLRYPWPPVAKRASEAVVKLERSDLVPQLIDLLDEPDARAPVLQEVNKKKVPVVRELVRINHHRNCMLCHAPGQASTFPTFGNNDLMTAQVPTPGDPLPTPSTGGYGNQIQDIVVRVDVTYLRQDFSVMQPVADAHPWPQLQRFDFLVRSRVLTQQEAKAYREKLSAQKQDGTTPYQRAALTALRALTGRDAEPTSQAWRQLLSASAGTSTGTTVMARLARE
jgi:hypothetical protein